MEKNIYAHNIPPKCLIPIIATFMYDVVNCSKSAVVVTFMPDIPYRVWVITRTEKDITIKISNKDIFRIDNGEGRIDDYLYNLDENGVRRMPNEFIGDTIDLTGLFIENDDYNLTAKEFCDKYINDWDAVIHRDMSELDDILDLFDVFIDYLAKVCDAQIDMDHRSQMISLIYSEPLEG